MFRFEDNVSANQLVPGLSQKSSLAHISAQVKQIEDAVIQTLEALDLVNKDLSVAAEETGQSDRLEPLRLDQLELHLDNMTLSKKAAERARTEVLVAAFQTLLERDKTAGAVVDAFKGYRDKLHQLTDTLEATAKEADHVITQGLSMYEGVDVGKAASISDLRDNLSMLLGLVKKTLDTIVDAADESDEMMKDIADPEKEVGPRLVLDSEGVVECPCGTPRESGRFVSVRPNNTPVIPSFPVPVVDVSEMPQTLKDRLGEPTTIDPANGMLCLECGRLFSSDVIGEAYIDGEFQKVPGYPNGAFFVDQENSRTADEELIRLAYVVAWVSNPVDNGPVIQNLGGFSAEELAWVTAVSKQHAG